MEPDAALRAPSPKLILQHLFISTVPLIAVLAASFLSPSSSQANTNWLSTQVVDSGPGFLVSEHRKL